jgi:hypothetical protein
MSQDEPDPEVLERLKRRIRERAAARYAKDTEFLETIGSEPIARTRTVAMIDLDALDLITVTTRSYPDRVGWDGNDRDGDRVTWILDSYEAREDLMLLAIALIAQAGGLLIRVRDAGFDLGPVLEEARADIVPEI